MSFEPRLVLYNPQMLGRVQSLEKLLDRMQTSGYAITDLKVASYPHEYADWPHYNQQARAEFAIAYNHRQLSFVATRPNDNFQVHLSLGWGEELFLKKERAYLDAVCWQTSDFNRDNENPKYYSRLFLDLGKSLYNSLLPTFGWIDMCEPGGYTFFDDVESLSMPHLYWANFFSAAYVEKIGRNHILTAPAWSIEELTDGGLLYILSPGPGNAEVTYEDHVPIDEVKKHFGIQSVR